MLSKKDIEKLNSELYSAVRPIILYDDDPDGLCSFLLFYKSVGDGKGIPIKSAPSLDVNFTSKVTEFSPDKVFILDKAVVTQEFIDSMNGLPVVWVDHHTPLNLKHVKYFNPRVKTPHKHKPTSYWCYMASGKKNLLWIATVGCVADWFIPEFLGEFIEKYPGFLEAKKYTDPGYLMFKTRLGVLIQIFSFVLKGKTSDVLKCMKIMTRINSPYEILEEQTSQGKFIYNYYKNIKKQYDVILADALSKKTDDSLFLYLYEDTKMSFTAELSNELLHKFPEKVIIIAREKNGEMRCSLRSGKHKIEPMLKKALLDVQGYGGGHEYACGASIKKDDFDKFLKLMREQIKE